MSFGYPPLRPVPSGISQQTHNNDIPDVLLHGRNHVKNGLQTSHPLEYSERNWQANKEKMDAVMLRNLQGIHAPLRLHMERRTASQVSRLPFLTSSNIMLDSLTGKLDTIEYDDILNVVTESEAAGQPHAVVEKHLNLL